MTSPLPGGAPRTCLVAGIDPGAHTGLVVLEIQTTPMPIEQLIDRVVWRATCQLHPITRKALRAEQLSVLMFERLRDRLRRWGVVEVAIEEPSDARDQWRAASPGTSFGVGRAFERCILAATYAGCTVHAYRVREWMPKTRTGNLQHNQKRDVTLAQLDALSREIRRRPLAGEPLRVTHVARAALERLSEDELMALGVLRYHLARQAPLPLLASAATR